MRILFVTTSYPSKKYSYSGIFVHSLAKSLVKRGHHIKVITPADDAQHGLETFDGIEVYRVWYAPKRLRILAHRPGGTVSAIKSMPLLILLLPCLVFFMVIQISRMAKHCDIIHAQWIVSAIFVRLSYMRSLEPHILLTLRGEEVNVLNNGVIGFLFKEYILGDIHGVTAVSHHIAIKMEKFLSTHQKPIKVYTIENGIDDKFFELDFPYIEDTMIMIYIGNIIKGKRVKSLIKVCKIIKEMNINFILRIVGDGIQKQEVLDLVKKYNLCDDIQINPPVSPDEIPNVLKGAHCFVLFSASEGRPNVMVEAMASGRAILATHLPGIVELMGSSNCGYTAPVDDIHALASIIQRAYESREMLHMMGQRARQRIQDLNLSWTNTARKYDNVYQSLVDGKPDRDT